MKLSKRMLVIVAILSMTLLIGAAFAVIWLRQSYTYTTGISQIGNLAFYNLDTTITYTNMTAISALTNFASIGNQTVSFTIANTGNQIIQLKVYMFNETFVPNNPIGWNEDTVTNQTIYYGTIVSNAIFGFFLSGNGTSLKWANNNGLSYANFNPLDTLDITLKVECFTLQQPCSSLPFNLMVVAA